MVYTKNFFKIFQLSEKKLEKYDFFLRCKGEGLVNVMLRGLIFWESVKKYREIMERSFLPVERLRKVVSKHGKRGEASLPFFIWVEVY